MKSLFIKSMACSLFLLLFVSCKKDETKTVASTGTTPVLTSSQNNLVLAVANSAQPATVLNWTASSFGYSAGVSYAVQLDSAGKNFAKPVEVALAQGLTKTFTVLELNNMLVQLGFKPDVAGKLEIRVKASIGDAYAPAYSNVTPIVVTPYQVIKLTPVLYVIGAYSNWSGATAVTIASVKDDEQYEGYINLPDASNEFKFTSAPDFNHINYGTLSPGTFIAGSGDNLKVQGAGYYLLKADTKGLTWTATKTVWAVIGDATGSWDNETPMTYDAASKVWTVTKVLSAGELKFRANGSYTINFGDNKPADGNLEYGGDNIPVTAAGNYKITLNLSVPGSYTYTITKQ
ncbi:SusE domain-containing protein [Pedobacter sp. UYP1]|jgi:hypothetical protein|uniref:SusE domain-containing protein n=1 Tax=Pedobacter sp. UYP1 TaxID=1756396 RepID=UPI0033975CF8